MDTRFLLALGALLCGCGGDAPAKETPTAKTTPGPAPAVASPAERKPNVVLIVIDTLGAENVGAYDPALTHTPNLDRLAAGGKRFERAYATAPWTQPSMASLFTSQMPANHLVRGLADTLAPEQNTLAEYLFEEEYKTQAFISNMLIKQGFGFGQGFLGYNERAEAGHDGITSERISDAAIRWIDKRSKEPFFLFLHYFDPHALYHEHPEFRQVGDYDGVLAPAMGIWETRDLRPQLAAADVEYLTGLYREEIAFTDHHIGRFLDHLEAKGLADDTLVILTSDHGEEFMRHGWIGHTRTLYNELVHIPLIVRYPGVVTPGAVETPVSLIDVLPTVMDLVAGTPTNPRWEGASLVPLLTGAPGDFPARPLFAEVTFRPKLQDGARSEEKTAFKTAVVLGDLKLIHDLRADTWELFEFGSDPLDVTDLWGSSPERDAKLRSLLEAWESAWRYPVDLSEEGAGNAEIDPELQQQLNDLGYSRGD